MPDETTAGALAPASPSVERPDARALLLLVLCSGLLTGLLEGSVLLVRQHVLGDILYASRDRLWVAPLANTLLFLLLALPLLAVARVRPRWVSWSVAVATFAFLLAFSTLLLFGQLGGWGALVLALGIGAQAGRLATGRAATLRRMLRRGSLALAAAVALLAGGLPLWRRVAERRALAGLPAAGQGAPNVLLLILDTVRASELSLYGFAEPTTPNLERRARQGVVFDMAVAAAPWTLPSHASMFTGRWPAELSAGWSHALDNSAPTIAEWMRGRGYATGGFTANWFYAGHDSGLERGFLHYEDHRLAWRDFTRTALTQTTLVRTLASARSATEAWRALRGASLAVQWQSDEKPASMVNGQFLAWQSRLPRERPFFAFLNFYDAHAPYQCPPGYRERFHCDRSPADAYAGAIASLDAEVERLLAELERRGTLENTIVILAADHGEQFGENGRTGHGNSLYLSLLRVPLVIWAPGRVPAGAHVAEPVSLRDLPATVADLTGGSAGTRPFPGVSLRRHWAGAPVPETGGPVLAQFSYMPHLQQRLPQFLEPSAALVSGELHYIRNGDGEEELYAYREDAFERLNQVREARFAPGLERLRLSMMSMDGGARRAARIVPRGGAGGR